MNVKKYTDRHAHLYQNFMKAQYFCSYYFRSRGIEASKETENTLSKLAQASTPLAEFFMVDFEGVQLKWKQVGFAVDLPADFKKVDVKQDGLRLVPVPWLIAHVGTSVYGNLGAVRARSVLFETDRFVDHVNCTENILEVADGQAAEDVFVDSVPQLGRETQ
jgi:hypothetical protein